MVRTPFHSLNANDDDDDAILRSPHSPFSRYPRLLRQYPFSYISYLSSVVVVVLLGLLLVVGLVVLDDPALVGLLPVEVGEDQVEDIRVPADWPAFDTFLDVLERQDVSISFRTNGT